MNIFIAHIEYNKALLTPEESWHCARVLRMKPGDAIKLIDGKGNFYEAALETVHDKHCSANVLNGPIKQNPRSYFLHIAIAPTKQIDRIEWMLEKCVEIGIDKISLIACKNSERKNVNTERLRKIAESAVKQSQQALIPEITDLKSFEALIHSANEPLKLIAHCENTVKNQLCTLDLKNASTLVMIGPEGDFSTDEIEGALQDGFKPISLGNNRLRTETAGLYVCQTAAILNL